MYTGSAAPDDRDPVPQPAGPAALSPLGSRAARATAWIVASYLTTTVLRVVSSLILTRLLYPEAFALVGLTFVVLQGLKMFSELGIGLSVVRHASGADEHFLSTAWTIQVVRGFVLCALAAGLAWPMSRFYGMPEIQGLVSAAGLLALIESFASASVFLVNRTLHVGRLTVLQLGETLLRTALTIGWALAYPTPWALVLPAFLTQFLYVAGTHAWLPGPRCRFRWDGAAALELLRFGGWVFLSTAITFTAMQGDRLVVGALAPPDVVGVYMIAAMLAGIPGQAVLQCSSAVFLPAVSEMMRDPAHDPSRLRLTRAAVLVVLAPIAAACIAGAEPAVRFLYDPRWHDAARLCALLVAGSWLNVLSASYGSVILAYGRPKVITMGTALRAVICGAGFWPVYRAWGIEGVAVLVSASELGVYGVCATAGVRLGVSTLAIDALLIAETAVLAISLRALGFALEESSWGEFGAAVVIGVCGLSLAGATAAIVLRRSPR